MISSLSRYTGITVLSSSTSFGIQKKQLLDEEIKKDFKVSYIFQGSIQSFGENTRLIIELNDLSENKIVWSDRFDFKLDLFAGEFYIFKKGICSTYLYFS